jgi:serine/threonine protein kinase
LKVLVVARLDDMGGFISKILNRKGFDVNVLDTSRQVKEALSEIRAELSRRESDLVLLTNTCLPPGMILNLVPEIKRSNPGIKIIVLSGFSTPEFVKDLKEQGTDDFLPLPFAPDDLVQKVTSIFDEPEEEKPHPISHKQRDFIGKDFEVYDVLGVGGFGVVYLVYSHETKSVYALKTFRDEYLEDAQTRDRFRKEAKVWIDLDRHPYIVRAYLVGEISGRLFIGLEYIAKDEHGLNSLEGYLRDNPPDLAQSLRWGIQFCHGMEYAYSKGIRAHRDIKPANIMISQDKTIKISDFGLAGVIGTSKAMSGIKLGIQKGRVGLSCQTMEGTSFGTPTHMPPEQFTNAASCDERSDIYSFGIVLYQMATRGKLPFLATLPRDNSEEESKRFWAEMYLLHSKAPLPKVNSPLFPITQRCLEKESHRRYRSFKELCLDLEKLLKRETGEVLNPPELKELEAWEWSNKGFSLSSLGRFDEALTCCNKALEIAPQLTKTWSCKGDILRNLGRFDEALTCCNKALEIDPQYTKTWSCKGDILINLDRFDEAILCYDKALEIDPRDTIALNNKAVSLKSLDRFDEAILCCNKALEIYQSEAAAWSNKGDCLVGLGRFDEAIPCYNKVLEIDQSKPLTWFKKALVEKQIHRGQDAIHSFQQFIEHAHGQYLAEVDHARQQLLELEK